MRKTANFILGILKVYFLGGLTSILFLMYLVITDSYFKNLDWGWNDYELKLEKFFLLTFYIPIWIMLIYGLSKLLTIKSWVDKLSCLIQSFFGILFFYIIDMKLKKILIISTSIMLNLIILMFLYLILFWLCWKFMKKGGSVSD